MTAPAAFRFSAAVLAGGRSSRMGTDKAFLSWDGQTLIERQLATLRALGPEELLLSGRDEVVYPGAEMRVVHDAIPDLGPLGGLAALLEATRTSHVVVLAVDLPLVTAPFLRTLLATSSRGRGAAARTADGWEPLAAVYPREILPLVTRRLAAGQRALQALLDEACAASLIVPVEGSDPALFTNVNRPDDIR